LRWGREAELRDTSILKRELGNERRVKEQLQEAKSL
jgi:hypothetical protein